MKTNTMGDNGYDIFSTVWQDIEIEVRHCKDWINMKSTGVQTDHIEVVAKDRQRLPITETGYRSHFISSSDLEEFGGAVELVQSLLNEASQTKAWKAYAASKVQGDLFL